MSKQEHITLAEVLKEIVDSRSRRGMSYEWEYLLELLAGAMLAGRRELKEMGRWVQENREELVILLQPAKGRVPSVATLRRVMQQVGVEGLEAALGKYQRQLENEVGDELGMGEEAGVITTRQGESLKLAALDGKVVRGASAHGEQV